MNFELNYEGFESCLVERRYEEGWGVQYLFRFENRFGASVIKNLGSYGREKGLWELAVILWYGAGKEDWTLEYGTPITDYVIVYLSDDEVKDLLKKIKEL